MTTAMYRTGMLLFIVWSSVGVVRDGDVPTCEIEGLKVVWIMIILEEYVGKDVVISLKWAENFRELLNIDVDFMEVDTVVLLGLIPALMCVYTCHACWDFS